VNNWDVMAPHAQMTFFAPDLGRLSVFEERLDLLPGAKKKKGRWSIPTNAFGPLAEMLKGSAIRVSGNAWGIEPRTTAGWAEIKSRLLAEGEVRPWVLDGFLTGYQEDAVAFGWTKSGVHYWHAAGAGKTITGTICGLADPGLLLIVTKAAIRLQFSRQIERFTTLRPFVVRPLSQTATQIRVRGESWHEFRSRHKGQGLSTRQMGIRWKAHQKACGIDPPKSIRGYVDECEEKGVRPVIVAGWEALVSNLDELVRLNIGSIVFDEIHAGKSSDRWTRVPLIEPGQDSTAKEIKELAVNQAREARDKKGFIKETDEGPMMFVPRMNQAAAGATLARRARKRIGMTASPIKDRVRDLWAQLDMVEPNAWGNKTSWMVRYADMKPGTYGGMDTTGNSRLPELKLRIDTVAHIRKYEETHRGLPEKRRQSVYLAPEDQNRPSGGFADEIRKARSRGPGAMLEVKLAQSASRKKKAVVGMAEDHLASKQKVVIFTARKRDCEDLGVALGRSKVAKKAGAQIWYAHGGMSTKRRQEMVDDYMAHPGPCAIVGTGAAFGTGLDIHDTDAAFFVMLPYTPGDLLQWEGRFSRRGGKRAVIIYYVICEGTVDEHIASILIDKLPSVEKVAEGTELASAGAVLAGLDEGMSDDEWIDSILGDIDY
jgi:superfamily II DNA or RNA helicase